VEWSGEGILLDMNAVCQLPDRAPVKMSRFQQCEYQQLNRVHMPVPVPENALLEYEAIVSSH